MAVRSQVEVFDEGGTLLCTNRCTTLFPTLGGYGGQPKDVVLCACSNKQLYEIEHAVQAIDPGCFIIMLQSNEVHGEGFRQLELGKNENKSE